MKLLSRFCSYSQFRHARHTWPAVHCLNSSHPVQVFVPWHHCRVQPQSNFIPFGNVTYTSKKVNVVKPLFAKAVEFSDRCAVEDVHGSHTYAELAERAAKLSKRINSLLGNNLGIDNSPRVSYLCPNNVSYVVTKWAIWNSGCIAVPLCLQHPQSEHEYFITDSQSSLVITTSEYASYMQQCTEKLNVQLIILNKEDYSENEKLDHTEGVQQDSSSAQDTSDTVQNLLARNGFKNLPALFVYTSGTTGRPKGVVHTYGSLQAQMDAMVSAWSWRSSDVVLHVLPLHHVHGVVNVLMTPLSCGAKCIMLPKFDAEKVWDYLLMNPDPRDASGSRINIFMGVPTVYVKLIEAYDKRIQEGSGDKAKAYIKSSCSQNIRLMVSGSAALPVSVMERWEDITGHRLLERYGMTETGMILTNPLHGERISATVGNPFPKVEVLIAKPNVYSKDGYDVIAKGNHNSTVVTPGMEEEQGELYVKGPNLFKEYWNKPEATAGTFSKGGWFKTGDTATYKDGAYRIVGRTSVDIIKSGGYKISALDVEDHLLKHENIQEVAVIGLPDITWGQKVAAVVSLKADDNDLSLEELRHWSKDLMPSYQVPSALVVTEKIPRNAMGKVNKKELAVQMFPEELKKF